MVISPAETSRPPTPKTTKVPAPLKRTSKGSMRALRSVTRWPLQFSSLNFAISRSSVAKDLTTRIGDIFLQDRGGTPRLFLAALDLPFPG